MFKKMISVLLTAIMVFGLAAPSFAVTEEYPTIYVTGAQTNDIYSADGVKVSDFSFDLKGVIAQEGKDLIKEFALGMISDNYEVWAKDFHDIVVGIFERSALDKNGEASDGSHPVNHSSTVDVKVKTENYGAWDYRFWYDWRLSPMVTCEELEAYIDRVLEATGKDKVNLVGRCYGANLIATYVEMNKDHAAAYVDDIFYFAPSIDGIDFMTGIFTGELYLDDVALENFAKWYIENENIIEDDAIASLVMALVELLRTAKVLGFTAEMIDLLIDRIKSDLIPPILRDTFGSWPSYWSMVSTGETPKAIDFVFDGCKEEYAGIISKINAYYENVQLNHYNTVMEMIGRGVRYNVFAKYNFPEYPIYEGAAIQSDGDTPIPKQTFGATAANFGEVLSASYIDSISQENLKYLSPDHKIDASTCLLPENTWFVKNLHHNYWAAIEGIALNIMNNDYNVSNQDVYPQFMDHYKDMAEVEPDEDFGKVKTGALASLMRFLTAFFNFISKILRGELVLGGQPA